MSCPTRHRAPPRSPALEDRPGVVRARPGLRVELDRARLQLGEVEALDGAVVERDVRRLGARRTARPRSRGSGSSRARGRSSARAPGGWRRGGRRGACTSRGRSRGRAAGGRGRCRARARGRAAPARPAPRSRAAPGRRGRSRGGRRRRRASSLGIDRVREDGDVRARAGEPAQDRALAAVVDDGDAAACPRRSRRTAPASTPGRRAQRLPSSVSRGTASSASASAHVARDRDRAHGAALAQAEHERAGVDAGQRDDPMLLQPVRPLRPARLAHQHRLRVRAGRLGPAGGDAVVADHRRREADELLGEARVGDGLLVAGHRGREDGLAEGDARGADGLAAEDRPVLEREEGAHPWTTRPSATVFSDGAAQLPAEQPGVGGAGAEAALLDRPLLSRGRAGRGWRGRRPRSCGSGRPSARAGPADMRSSSVSSGTSPVSTRWV